MGQSILVFLSGLGVSQVFNFAFTLVTARALGAAGFGILSYGLAFSRVFSTIADLGIRKVQVRDLAAGDAEHESYVHRVLGLKLVLSLGAAASTTLAAWALQGSSILGVMALLSVTAAAASISQVFFGALQAKGSLEAEAASQALRGAILLAGGVAIAFGLPSPAAFAALYLAAELAILVLAAAAYKRGGPRLGASLDLTAWRALVKESVPFGLTSAFEMIYHWLDTIILAQMATAAIVGYYNAAYRLFLVTLLAPSAVSVVLFPVMARHHAAGDPQLKEVFRCYFLYLLLLGLPAAVMIGLLAGPIVRLVFGPGFASSADALRVLIVSLALISANSAFVRLLESSGRQGVVSWICGGSALLNVALNLALIPRWGQLGAAAATVASEAFITLGAVIAVDRLRYGLDNRALLRVSGGLGTSAVFALLPALALYGRSPAVACAAFAAVYTAAVSLTGAVSADDVSSFAAAMRMKTKKNSIASPTPTEKIR